MTGEVRAGVKFAALGFAAMLGCAAPAAAGTAPASSMPGPIAALQARLAGLGYAPGPVDGVMSAKTQQAMLAYRRASGQPIWSGSAGGPAGNPIVAAQISLQRLGFLSAPADGVIGPQTRDAIIRFQAARRLPIDPRVSDRLLAALDRASAPAATANPPSAAPSPAAAPAEPAITGRQALPLGVTPPPIR